ncbi:MAG: formylglycine-generating enzyme family protein [Planctomycetes bacterium]|nr:formylglycine-generating enzyme family protein [Planctomycetota bacterium]
MVRIAPGSFQMGSNTVNLTKEFWMGRTEVTQEQWAEVMGSNPADFKGANLPVENVSWDDAVAFCKKLTERERSAGLLPEGWRYSLPTEAQWEYAYRAGTTGPYAGDLDAMAWYYSNSGNQTHPVGQKKPNAWGLYDMHGNVWEWCLDWYQDDITSYTSDPYGPASGSNRVRRGGSWNYIAQYCRSAYRGSSTPSFWDYILGFRLVLAGP